MEKNNKQDLLLILASITLLVLVKFVNIFPVWVFFGLVPLFVLFHNQQKEASVKPLLFLKIFSVFLVVFLIWNCSYFNSTAISWLFPVIYSVAITFSFIIYSFTNKYAKNRLGFFTILIYWLAIEFLMYYAHPQFSRFMLATAFNEHPEYVSWNVHTGFMGVSLWILLANITLFYALFKDQAMSKGKINPVALIITITIIALPALFNNDTTAILHLDLLNEGTNASKQISGNGEYIGKTAVWVSILLILYSFVKKEVNK